MSSASSAEGHPSFAWMRGDHRSVVALLDDLERAAELADLRRGVEALRSLLEVHFAREEEPGGLDSLVEGEAPRLLAEVARLRDEHREILKRIAEIDGLLARAELDPRPRPDTEVAELCRMLRAHEAAENALLLDTLEQEMGAGD